MSTIENNSNALRINQLYTDIRNFELELIQQRQELSEGRKQELGEKENTEHESIYVNEIEEVLILTYYNVIQGNLLVPVVKFSLEPLYFNCHLEFGTNSGLKEFVDLQIQIPLLSINEKVNNHNLIFINGMLQLSDPKSEHFTDELTSIIGKIEGFKTAHPSPY